MIEIGRLELGKTPVVVGVVDAIVSIQDLLDLKEAGVAMLEIRADLINEPLDCIEKYVRDIKRACALPLIGTVRENDRTHSKRLDYFSKIMPWVDCVDIELGTALSSEIRAIAAGKRILVSDHDFDKTPNEAALQAMVDRAIAQGAEIVKIVTMANTEDDAWRLLKFAKEYTSPIVAFAMGEAGAFSRVRACEFGSLFTYGYITSAVAPGQLSALELVKKIAPLR